MRKTRIIVLSISIILLLLLYFHFNKQKKLADEIRESILEQKREQEQMEASKFLKYEILKKEELGDNRIKISIVLSKNCTKKEAEKYMRACAKGYPGKQIIAYLNKSDKKPYAIYTFGIGDRCHAPVDEIRFFKTKKK